MALPDSLVTVLAYAVYMDRTGEPCTGSVSMIAEELLVSETDGVTIQPVNEKVTVDDTGRFELRVPASNSPGWGPANFTYLVKENLSTGVKSYRVMIPYDSVGGEFNLNTAAPVEDNPDPVTYVLNTSADQPGGYAKINAATGYIPAGVIPPTVVSAAITTHVEATDPHGDRAFATDAFEAVYELTEDFLNRVAAIEGGTAFLAALNVTGNAAIGGTLTVTGPGVLGGRNGLLSFRPAGRITYPGSPVLGTGTWEAGDMIIDSTGRWHLCTVGGDPGTWATAS